MIPILAALLSFDPTLAGAGDAIPEIVPHPLVIHTIPLSDRRLRGDYEVGGRVAMVYTDGWPETLAVLAGQVVQSGAQLVVVREDDSTARAYRRFMADLERSYGARVDGLADSVDTPWIRDWGPIQVERDARPLWLDSDYEDDERVRDDVGPQLLASTYRGTLTPLTWALDGGAMVSNGAGLCVLTLEYIEEEELELEADDIGAMLARLGCRATALVPTLIHDSTKHADMIMQFTAVDRVMIAEIVGDDDEHGEDSVRMDAAVHGVRLAAAALDLELEVVRVPTPTSERSHSFVNGVRLADRYLMPSYPELDETLNLAAWSAVQTAMDEVPVVPIDASELIELGGALHCMMLGLF